jgi:pilus assembly protein Flp/PilA
MERINLWVGEFLSRAQAIREADGQAMIEYALILALVSVAAVTILSTLGVSVSSIFDQINTDLEGGWTGRGGERSSEPRALSRLGLGLYHDRA